MNCRSISEDNLMSHHLHRAHTVARLPLQVAPAVVRHSVSSWVSCVSLSACAWALSSYADSVEISTNAPSGVMEGQTLELSCTQSADPGISISSITWTTPTNMMTTTTDMDFLVHTIDQVTSADEGNYTCSIDYGNSTVTRTHELTFLPGEASMQLPLHWSFFVQNGQPTTNFSK